MNVIRTFLDREPGRVFISSKLMVSYVHGIGSGNNRMCSSFCSSSCEKKNGKTDLFVE